MKRNHLIVAIGAGVVLLLLLRRRSAAASSSPLAGGFLPVGLASIYFDPGQTFDVNANAYSPGYGSPINRSN